MLYITISSGNKVVAHTAHVGDTNTIQECKEKYVELASNGHVKTNVTLQADGHELEYVEEQMEGIPKTPKQRVVTWPSPWSEFILMNLNFEI